MIAVLMNQYPDAVIILHRFIAPSLVSLHHLCILMKPFSVFLSNNTKIWLKDIELQGQVVQLE